MLSNFLKALLISGTTLLLIACNKQSDYIILIKNPNKLQASLNTCPNDKATNDSKACQQAKAVQTAIELFRNVQQQQALQYPNAQQELVQYKQLVERAKSDKQLRNQIQTELAGVTQYYLNVSENYGKEIIKQEVKLGKQKAKLLQLKNSNFSDYSAIKALEKRINLTQNTIQAMLALINVTTGGQG